MKRIIGFTLAVVLAAATIYITIPSKKTDLNQKKLTIINFIDHPVLNTIESELVAGIRSKYSEHEVDISILSSQGRVEEIPQLARTVTSRSPDVIVTISTPVSKGVMKELDGNQKIVYTFVTNPQDLGADLSRTNSTGLSDAVNYSSNIRLIEEVLGKSTKIGFLYNPNEPNSVSGLESIEKVIDTKSLSLSKVAVMTESDLPQAVSSLAKTVDVIYVGGDNLTVGSFQIIRKIALENNIPVFASDSGSVRAGAVAGYSVDYEKFGKSSSEVVIEVLKGTEPRNIRRKTISGDKLIVNLQAMRAFGIRLPQNLISSADEVIR
ncbi:ABC transporter substrate-binding protein [Planctobacterium marinum]|uniref:ABC transporter substrate-binding protein n=1 Tax=Planctobacterium marinum TaxID=1631968 RepID=UPI001E5382CB|nr:ABC transporter substrate-binding protein [Planctobacterium marinum]MCC2607139.1 ABC transporter substrate-binding protein [Planctobacterium marinum]